MRSTFLTARVALAALGALALAACADGASTGPDRGGTPAFQILYGDPPTTPTVTTPHAPDFEYVEVCKIGSEASFLASHNDDILGSQTVEFALDDGGCRETAVLSYGDGVFEVAETGVPVGYVLDRIVVTFQARVGGVDQPPVQSTITGQSFARIDPADNTGGWLVEFYNVRESNGCTRTIGYWKNWDGGGPQSDQVSQFLPVTLGAGGGKSVVVSNTTISNDILSFSYAGGHPSNGITKLYAQLLGAKLNIASGATGSAIASTITAADAFLVTKNQGDWSALAKAQQQQVKAWMSALDGYNNGVTGPGHCE
jgi:hypothetical protein